jgi:hypothetical protein
VLVRPAVVATVAIVAACTPAVNAPTPSVSIARTSTAPASPTAAAPIATPNASSVTSPGPAGPNVVTVALDDLQIPSVADADVLLTTRPLDGGKRTRIEAIDLRTRAVTMVRDGGANVQVTDVRDGVLTYIEQTEGAEPFHPRLQIFAGRWRDPASIVQVDDLVVPLIGGDSWNPWPSPQTNGWEVAWMHKTADSPYELRMREADGQMHVAYSSKTPFAFALGRTGDVALGELAPFGQTAPVALRLYSAGTTRLLMQRAPEGMGSVSWQLDQIIWNNGLGVSRRIVSVERIAPATLSRETVSPPQGCDSYAGITDEHVLWTCGPARVDIVGPGASRLSMGLPSPIPHQRAIIQDQVGPPRSATIVLVTADIARPGSGARF